MSIAVGLKLLRIHKVLPFNLKHNNTIGIVHSFVVSDHRQDLVDVPR